MYILIDNYDSFTYNLFHYFVELGADVEVYRNDAIGVTDVFAKNPSGLILSPGPCTPNEAGICLDLLAQAPPDLPVLGVCLGHQSIGQICGGKVIKAPQVMHGKTSPVSHNSKALFTDLPDPLIATRYHSLIVEAESLPQELEITATTQDGIIMGLQHRSKPWHGVQFHPESIASDKGHALLQNFLTLCETGV